MKSNVSGKTKAGIILTTVLCIALLVIEIMGLVNGLAKGSANMIVHAAFSIVMSILILLYVFIGYRKPHGNMLRVVYFIFGCYIAIMAIIEVTDGLYASCGCLMFAALIICYISGRLNKIEKNQKLLIIVGILLLAAWILTNFVFGPGVIKPIRILGSIGNMISLAALGVAYIARFQEHTAAGLEDK